MVSAARSAALAFAVVYFTFFLDNVLLTVLVPIIPDWVRGESLALWAERGAPLAKLLNSTVQNIAADTDGVGASTAAVGAVLGAKAAAQLLAAPAAAAVAGRRGPAAALRLATAALAAAALAFAWCGAWCSGAWGVWCAGGARALHGAAAALAGVAGLALAAALRPPRVAALLGAVALGVLVGYPFGGTAYLLWSQQAPFEIIAAALLLNLGLQYVILERNEYEELESAAGATGAVAAGRWGGVGAAARGAGGAAAGAVLLSTAVMAALEPGLPLWLHHKFHPPRWVSGWMFVPDSACYLLATSALGRAGGAHTHALALAGELTVALGALALPHASSVWWCGVWQGAVGGGLGAVDAALVPALVSRAPAPAPAAALLQAAAAAAYVAGPVIAGVVSWWFSFETAMRLLGVANLLYAAYLQRALAAHPLSQRGDDEPAAELTPLH